MRQNTIQNETSNTINSLSNFNPNNNISAQRISQGGVGLLNPLSTQRQQQQQGLVNGIIGNNNMNMANIQAGSMPNSMNNTNAINGMNGLLGNVNYANGNGNFNSQQSIQANMNQSTVNQNSNLNSFNVNDFMRLQQQLQQQQLQQQLQLQHQMQQQLQQQQAQIGSGMKNPNAQNMNFALMAAQQNQNQNQSQANNNFSNNNILQSFIGRNPQFTGSGGLPLQGQVNMHQNPFLGQLMLNQQQNGIGTIGAAGLVGSNPAGTMIPGMVGGANNFQLPSPNSIFSRDANRRMRGGVIEPFPEKLHRLLLEVEAAGRADVISFVANGRAFAIHKADQFFKEIVPLYFRQSRLSSFKRQLNLYGFELINTGPARGGYYHEMFVKERPELCRRMRRVALKIAPSSKDSTGKKKSKNKDSEADDSNPSEADSTSIKEMTKEDNVGTESLEDLEGVKKDDKEETAKETTDASIEENIDKAENGMKENVDVKMNEQIEDETVMVIKQVTEETDHVDKDVKEETDVSEEKCNEESVEQNSKTDTEGPQEQKIENEKDPKT